MIKRLLPLIALLPAAGFAADIRVSAGDMENLGIRLAAPLRVSEVAATEGSAEVVIPPAGEAVVGAPLAGLLTGLYVANGDDVTAGQVLAELRSPDFVSLQREFLDALNTERLAASELDRDRQLHAEGIISARRMQETLTRSRIAESGLNEHRQLLQVAGLDGAGIRSLESGGGLLETLAIRAPFAGVILERMATAGQRVDAMSPLYRLADLSELWLEIAVPQERISGVRPGMAVTVGSDSFRAEVTAIGRAIDPATQAIVVRATVTDGAESLRPGQFVPVQVVVEDTGIEVWTVPPSAVTRSGDAHYLFVDVADGFSVRQVEVVGMTGDAAYLAGGLDASDRVAVSGISALKAMWAAGEEADAG